MSMNYYSDEEEFSPSASHHSKSKKRSKSKKSNRKASAATRDTKNFMKDINNILDDNDEAVLQNPKSTRMTMTINRNINPSNIINHTSGGGNAPSTGPPRARGTMRHTIVNRNAPLKQPARYDEQESSYKNKSRTSLRSKSRGSSHDDDDDDYDSEDDDDFDENQGPSAQALAMRDRFRQERLEKQQQQQQQQSQQDARGKSSDGGTGAPVSARRTMAKERLKTTIQNVKSRPTVMGQQPPQQQQNAKLPNKRFTIAPGAASNNAPSHAANSPQPGNSRMSVRKSRATTLQSNKSNATRPVTTPADTRLNVRDVYNSSSSDNDSDYYDSSSEETDSDDDDDDDDSEDYDVNVTGESSMLEESTVSVIDPKVEESKADPLIYDMLMLGDGGVGKTSLLDSFISDSFSPEYVSTRGINQHSSTLYMGERKMLDRGKLKKRHVHVKLNIWDIGGRLTKHNYIKNSYILNSIIVIVVYDVTSLESYVNAIETIKHVRHIQHDQMIVLVGNKADNSTVAADDDDFDSDEDEANIVVVQPPPTGFRRLSTLVTRRGSALNATGQVQPAPSATREGVEENGEPPQLLREIAKREAALEALKLGALFFETSAKTGHNIYILFNEISKILVHKRRKLLFKIEAGIKRMQEENDEHSSDFESDSSSDESDYDSGDENDEEGKSVELDEDGNPVRKKKLKKKKKKEVEDESSSDDSVLSAMSDWSDEDEDDDDDYVDVYGWGGKKKTEKEDCVIM
mmetsp:Transcript_590/g.1390  ORF Transcript_590/g.1390 Transcript_590/m.1390 type:complete len:744 (+) Transcript_590:228-2459(+)